MRWVRVSQHAKVFSSSVLTNILGTKFAISVAHGDILTATTLGFLLPLISAFNMLCFIEAGTRRERIELAFINATALSLGTWIALSSC